MIQYVLHDVVAQFFLSLPLLLVRFNEPREVFIRIDLLVARVVVVQLENAACVVQLILNLVFVQRHHIGGCIIHYGGSLRAPAVDNLFRIAFRGSSSSDRKDEGSS